MICLAKFFRGFVLASEHQTDRSEHDNKRIQDATERKYLLLLLQARAYRLGIMNASTVPTHLRFDISGLASAMTSSVAIDSLQCTFAQPQWDVLAAYLQPGEFRNGQVLMAQRDEDRTLYFIESGTLAVHYEDEKARVRMAMVGPGTVLGEGAFFAQQPRSATVQASTLCKLWSLTLQRFKELAHRHPAIALELTLGMAGVMARRLYSRPKRVAVT